MKRGTKAFGLFGLTLTVLLMLNSKYVKSKTGKQSSEEKFSKPQLTSTETNSDPDNMGIDSVDLENITGIHVITITYFTNGAPEAPTLNLGGTNPWLAKAILENAVDSLDQILPENNIVYDGEMVYEPYEWYEEDDISGDEE